MKKEMQASILCVCANMSIVITFLVFMQWMGHIHNEKFGDNATHVSRVQ